MRRLSLALLLLVFLCSLLVLASNAVEIVYFPEPGCPKCQRVGTFLEGMQEAHEGLIIHRYEIHTFEARDLLVRLLSAYEAEIGPVPLLFVGDVAMVGGTFYGLEDEPVTLSERDAELVLRKVILQAIDAEAPSPLTKLPSIATEAVFVTVENCPECERLEEFLVEMVRRYPELEVRRLVLGEEKDDQLFERLLRLFGARGTPPALFVAEMALVGGTSYIRGQAPQSFTFTEEDKEHLEETIEQAVTQKAASPVERLRLREQLTLWAVVGAAALDSVNPCDFAVLILLLGTLLVIGRRGKVLWAGLAFTSAIYISYFLMGFLVYTVLGLTIGTRGFREPFILSVSSLAILVGLWQMKDLLWYGRWLTIEVPERWKPTLKRITSSAVTIPGAFVAGVLDSLFLAPCTSGPYLAILSLLSQTTSRLQGVGLLLLYNLIFILPLLFITVAVHLGFTTTARAERWRSARLGTLHFASGVVMVLLGVGMIVGVRLGYI